MLVAGYQDGPVRGRRDGNWRLGHWSRIVSARRRRLRTFLREGLPAAASVVDAREEDLAFGAKLARVRYEFVADGRPQRGSDLVLPYVADRWRSGDPLEVLYLPARDYDSVIVGWP